MALDDIRSDRISKLGRYEKAGHDPYPASVRRDFLIGEVVRRFGAFLRSRRHIYVAGRVFAMRGHGGMTFMDVADGSGSVQIVLERGELAGGYDAALTSIDIGDFLGVAGVPFKTKRGEPTIRVSEWRIISKSLRPLPEKWHGLKDVEERFRRRYLDLLMNPEVRERFRARSAIVSAIRQFFDGEGFLEVETPMLQHLAGGALAKPFRTRHNALDADFYLRIAPELYMKELLIGGFDKVYELGKSFRNEGIDATHNPEFTTVEWYAAYWDEEAMMECVERCLAFVFKRMGIKKGGVSFNGKTIRFGKKFVRIPFAEVLKRHALVVDYDAETPDSLGEKARQFGIEIDAGTPKGKIADEIFKKICRPRLTQPTFVIHHPVDISPLAKRVHGGSHTVRRLQLIAGGLEIVNAYSELNDPREQRRRFEEQNRRWRGGEAEEAHPASEEFVEALEYGMPPAAGAGIGIDRLVMLLTDTLNIREVVLFPTLRPK